MLAGIYHSSGNPARVTKYLQHADELSMNSIKYTTKVKDITKFEKQKPEVSVNLFGYEYNKIHPLRLSEYIKHVILMYFTS